MAFHHLDGYTPPPLSLVQLLQSDSHLNQVLMAFARTGDGEALKKSVFELAQAGDIGAELFLAEQYIPEQCPLEPNQDVPHCGRNGEEPPKIVFRTNRLKLPASYEEAMRWLEKSSAHGSGEASEVLAQLITRIHANGHVTHYTAEDSARFHALARSQGFDVEPLSVTCFKLIPGANGITLGRAPGGEPASEGFTHSELDALAKQGISGSLEYGGGIQGSDSALLMRPEGPVAQVRIILDHDPGHEVLLPVPAHHNVIYVQRGGHFLAFPETGNVLSRFVSVVSLKQDIPQISVYVQSINGGIRWRFLHSLPLER